MTLAELKTKWNGIAGKTAAFMIQPSHRPMKKEECGEGNVPAFESVCDQAHSFVAEAWIRTEDGAIEVRQTGEGFAWREHPLSEGVVKILPLENGQKIRWIEVWQPRVDDLLDGFETLKPAYGYFDGFVKDGK